MRRKILFTVFKNSFCSRGSQVFKICDVIHSTKFWSNMKKDISANLYQKSLILCSKITLNVLHNTSTAVLLPWQCTGFQTSQILKALLATYMYGVPFWYLHMVPTKFQWSVMQIGQDSCIDIHVLHIIFGWVYDVMSYLICIFYTFFKHKYLRN